VVSVIIDQLGSATLRKLEPLLAADGLLAHARRHGLVYEQMVYPYAATLTAPGHAAIYSGAAPDRSGITTNYLIDAASGKRRAIVDDGTHAVLGVPGKFAAPGVMRAETVADMLKTATHGAGKVVSLSIKDRSAILPASMSFSRSMPVSTPMPCSMYTRSSVARLPAAPGAYGQPPRPATDASRSRTPSSKPTRAFARAVPRVS